LKLIIKSTFLFRQKTKLPFEKVFKGRFFV
jgi:hypothetical protein